MIELIPAIDIIGGKCVRLSQGDYASRKVYNEYPIEVARELEDGGIRRLHVVDLDGAASHHIVNYKVLEEIATRTSLIVDFGGGLKTDEDLRIAFESGAQMVTGGSIAVKHPEVFSRWITAYGAGRIILGADAKDKRIAVSGWREDSELDLFEFVDGYRRQGVTQVICTDIRRDGMLQGPAVDLYREMLARDSGLHLIASGGVSGMDDIYRLQDITINGGKKGTLNEDLQDNGNMKYTVAFSVETSDVTLSITTKKLKEVTINAASDQELVYTGKANPIQFTTTPAGLARKEFRRTGSGKCRQL